MNTAMHPVEQPPAPPLALLVEDNDDVRKLRAQLFKDHGFAVVQVASYKDACQELRALPSIDILVTDVSLVPGDHSDRSGIALARKIREERPKLPIIGYSGWFERTELPEADSIPFTAIYTRGDQTPKKMMQDVAEWYSKALEFRCERRAQALAILRELRGHGISDYIINFLREFIPGHYGSAPEGDSDPPEIVLSRAGYRLKIVEAGRKVVDPNRREKSTKQPFPVWLQSVDDGIVAEVYRYPMLYAWAESDEQAIEQLLILMEGFKSDFEGTSTEESEDIAEMRKFLFSVIG